MSDGIITKVLSKLNEADAAKQSESFVMVNVRPGPKISAMLDVFSHLSQQTPSIMMADKLSKKLAEYAASSSSHALSVLEAAEIAIESRNGISSESALGLLQKEKLLNINNPFMRNLKI